MDMLALQSAAGIKGSTGSIGTSKLDEAISVLDDLARQKPESAPMIARMKQDLQKEFGPGATRPAGAEPNQVRTPSPGQSPATIPSAPPPPQVPMAGVPGGQ